MARRATYYCVFAGVISGHPLEDMDTDLLLSKVIQPTVQRVAADEVQHLG
jgi:hypothetical protein